ncbi:peroxiredoxin family protein [Parahaliea mediterranea]|uniref:Peroxiredoxin family protein n=1 Tax=Parahaliea mediterranea TaxID=651086 RepID=A0A939IM68_9GAMM|nr:peroxiredoxin family protein [Parahaliea mediterranea]MBN7796713.1 peroxiredoxin family protein [Parahaliea mediterranea]
MQRVLIVLAVLLLLATGLVYVYQDDVKEKAYAKLTENMFVAGDDDDFDPGPALGSDFPGVRARYQGQQIQLLAPFAGTNGTVFIASRSLDWCPYCMKQMVQLQQHKPGFDAAGIGMVAITYDTPEQLRAFAERHGITIPLLSDIDAMTFKTLGILNQQYQSGDAQYGIPHPGMIVIDPEGKVVGKLFLEAYSSRVDSAAALAYARQALAL